MKPKITLCLALGILFVIWRQAWAFSTEDQIKPGDFKNIPPFFAVKTHDEGANKRFHIIIDPKHDGLGNTLYGTLSIYDRKNRLISQCEILPRRPEEKTQALSPKLKLQGVDFEFLVSTNYLASSKFSFNYESTLGSGFDAYWFYLQDFADEK